MRPKHFLVLVITVGVVLVIMKSIWISFFNKASKQLILSGISYDGTQSCKPCDKANISEFPNTCDYCVDGVNIHNYHTISDERCRSIQACQFHSCKAAIDIVILWVNSNDVNMKKLLDTTNIYTEMNALHSINSISTKRMQRMEKKLPSGNSNKNFTRSVKRNLQRSNSLNRFRDLNQLKYLLRSIEENGREWARRIFLVTNNQIPDFLNIKHPRIRIISHQQLFQYSNVTPPLYPLFNSIAIQSMVHNIPTLSSPFYLFDDDIIIKKELPINLIINGSKSIIDLDITTHNIFREPYEIYQANIHSAIKLILSNKSVPLLKSNHSYHIAFHGPLLLYREIGKKIWDKFRPEMDAILSHPFRVPNDPSIQTLYIYVGYSDYYMFLKNRNILSFELLGSKDPKTLDAIVKKALSDQSAYFICLNDNLPSVNKTLQGILSAAYENVFPTKSSFEH